MDINKFVKEDLGKLTKNTKLLKTIGIVGGIGLTLLGVINDNNDRAALKADLKDEILKDLLKKDQ